MRHVLFKFLVSLIKTSPEVYGAFMDHRGWDAFTVGGDGGWMDGWMDDGRMGGWMDELKGGWMDG